MKKLLSVLLIAMLIISSAACGEKAVEMGNNEIAKLLNEGFYCSMTSYDEEVWKGLFVKEDSYEKLYVVEAETGKDVYEKMAAIAFDEEDADAKMNVILTNLENVSVTDVTDKIPTQEELDKYIGKTLGDLENDGFENSGNSNYEGVYNFYYDGPVYSVIVELEDGVLIEDMDDYSANDLRKLRIGGMEFSGISYTLLNND